MPVFCRCLASRGHCAIVKKNEIQQMFGQEERPLTLMLKNGMPVANNSTVKQFTTAPEDMKQQSQKKRIDLELAHARFVRPSRALLAASSTEIWNDLTIRMSPDADCISCRISTELQQGSSINPHMLPSRDRSSMWISYHQFLLRALLLRVIFQLY